MSLLVLLQILIAAAVVDFIIAASSGEGFLRCVQHAAVPGKAACMAVAVSVEAPQHSSCSCSCSSSSVAHAMVTYPGCIDQSLQLDACTQLQQQDRAQLWANRVVCCEVTACN